jgi:hypothetical protein
LFSVRLEAEVGSGRQCYYEPTNPNEERTMTQYLLTVIQPQGAPPAPEALAKIMQNVEALHDEIKAAGAWVFSGGLHAPSTATVMRMQDGEVLMTDGPFVEAKEYIGGILIVDAPDLDSALKWGRKAVIATTLPIEVRPFHRVSTR